MLIVAKKRPWSNNGIVLMPHSFAKERASCSVHSTTVILIKRMAFRPCASKTMVKASVKKRSREEFDNNGRQG